MSSLYNEISLGELPDMQGVFMFRSADPTKQTFEPNYYLKDDMSELDVKSNIQVNYIEYFKNANGDRLDNILPLRHKYYIVPNRPATYKEVLVIDSPIQYYQIGEQITPPVYYQIGEVITPEELYQTGEDMGNGQLANGGELKTPAVLCQQQNTDIKTPAVICSESDTVVKSGEVSHYETVEDEPAWMAANDWFMGLARTPITETFGILDKIEYTLGGMPQNVPNGYVLQGQ